MKISVLSEAQVIEIKEMTEEILENTGFRVPHQGMQRIAARAGAKVDETDQIIRLPRPLLGELLAQIPPSYAIRGVDGVRHEVGAGKQHCLALTTDPWIIDYRTQSPRRPCLDDVIRHTAIAQRLEHVTAVSRMDFPVTDYADGTSSLRALEAHLLNHVKHYFVYATGLDDFHIWMELGDILNRGGGLDKSGLMSVAVAVISPLTLTDINVELLLGAANKSFPIVPTICPMAGMTSPYSKDSTLLLGNAENIFLAALAQIVNPGNPFLYALGPSRGNMANGSDMYYTLDKILWKIAAVELAKSYGIPAFAECGGSMTHRYDMQTGAEGLLFMLAAQNSGADFLTGLGSCYNANGMSAEMMVIQSEWLKVSRFLSRGISTDTLKPGMKSLSEAGYGGNFLLDDLTIEFLRSDEFFDPALLDYSGDRDAPPLLERAHEMVESLVYGYRSPVPEKIQVELRRYFLSLYTNMKS